MNARTSDRLDLKADSTDTYHSSPSFFTGKRDETPTLSGRQVYVSQPKKHTRPRSSLASSHTGKH